MRYLITLSGCDDSTVLDMELTGAEVALLERVAAESVAASECDCQPVLEIALAPPTDREPDPDHVRDAALDERNGVTP